MTTTKFATPKKGLAKPHRPKGRGVRPLARRASPTVSNAHSNVSLVYMITGVPCEDHTAIIKRIRSGLPASSIEKLEAAYKASRKEIAACLSISIPTLRRRLLNGRLHIDESDRVVRLARVKDLAVALMQGDDDAAIEWLHTPQELLQGESPLSYASTELGAYDVEDLIGRIRHGVFS